MLSRRKKKKKWIRVTTHSQVQQHSGMRTGTRIRVFLTSLPAHATSVLIIRGETRNGPIRYTHMAPPGINLRWNVRLRFYQYATFDRANGNYLPYRFVTHALRFHRTCAQTLRIHIHVPFSSPFVAFLSLFPLSFHPPLFSLFLQLYLAFSRFPRIPVYELGCSVFYRILTSSVFASNHTRV